MNCDEITALIGDQTIGREIVVLRETKSTNDLAIRAGEEGATEGLVFFAEKQTGGRGRHGRLWDSIEGENLMLSILLRPEFETRFWPRITLTTALAVAETVESICGVSVGIKWPNDILVAGRKICGILLESRINSTGGAFVVVGIGLNVNQVRFPAELATKATSMRLTAGSSVAEGTAVSRMQVAVELLLHFQQVYDRTGEDFASILEETTRRSTLLGRDIVLVVGEKEMSGTVTGFDSEGGLLLETPQGDQRTVSSGEVMHVVSYR